MKDLSPMLYWTKGQCKLYCMTMTGEEENFLLNNLLAPFDIIAKDQLPRHPFLEDASDAYSLTTDMIKYRRWISKHHSKINSCLFESLSTNKLTLKERRDWLMALASYGKRYFASFYKHLPSSKHFSSCMIDNFLVSSSSILIVCDCTY